MGKELNRSTVLLAKSFPEISFVDCNGRHWESKKQEAEADQDCPRRPRSNEIASRTPTTVTFQVRTMRYVALLSGGKDSCYNLLHCERNGHKLVAAASLGPGTGKGPALFHSMTTSIEPFHQYRRTGFISLSNCRAGCD